MTTNIWVPKDFNNTSIDEIVDDYSNAIPVSRPHGVILLDGKVVADTLQCPHCGGHFFPVKGKARLVCNIHRAKVCDNLRCNTVCTDYYSEVDQLSVREI